MILLVNIKNLAMKIKTKFVSVDLGYLPYLIFAFKAAILSSTK